MNLLANWLLSAICLMLVSYLVPGFKVDGFLAALLAALVVGIVNATLGLVLKIITLPLTVITFGIFLLIINALMIKLSAWLVPGFEVHGFWPALLGALVLALIGFLVRAIFGRPKTYEARVD